MELHQIWLSGNSGWTSMVIGPSSGKKVNLVDRVKSNKKSYDIFCYLNKKKQIGLTKKC